MNVNEIETEIEELETRIERLRALYEQYFMGIERLEPQIPRKDVERRIWVLRREQIRNTGLRFKCQMLIQRYNTYQQHWSRVTREIENGTYKRDVLRAASRVGAREAMTIVGRRRAARYAVLTEAQDEAAAARRPEAEGERPASTGSAPPSEGPEAPQPTPSGTHLMPEARPSGLRAVDPELAKRRLAELAAGMRQRTGPAEQAQAAGPLDLDLDGAASSARGARALPDGAREAEGSPAARAAPAARMPPLRLPNPPALPAAQPPRPPPSASGVMGSGVPLSQARLPPPNLPPPRPLPPPPPSSAQARPFEPVPPASNRPLPPPLPSRLPPPPPSSRSAVPPPAGPPSSRLPPPPSNRLPPPPPSSRVAVPQAPPAAAATRAVASAAAPAASRFGVPPTGARAGLPPLPASPPTAAPSARPSRTGQVDGISDDRLRQIYSEYVQTKRSVQESTAGVTYDKLARSLRDQTEKLRAAHGTRSVDFEVVVKDGKAVIRPIMR